MPFQTPLDICYFALKAAGVTGAGITANAEDINDTFTALNGMLAQWQRKRWLIWHLVDVACVTTGAQSYSVGIGGDFNVMRPDRLEYAYMRQFINSSPNQVDYPLSILESREDYSRIALKQLSSFSNSVFYDAAFPFGRVYPFPIPEASIYELHLVLKETLNQFVTLQQSIALAPEYEEAMWTNLMVRVCIMYRLPQDPANIALAKQSLEVIRGANVQIPRLTMPDGLAQGARYNIYSDVVY